MIQLTDFEGQNWLITPAALALNDPRPRDIHDQKWLLVLSGVVRAGLWGDEKDPEVQILPDVPALAIMQSITTAFLDRLEPKALNTMWRFKQNCGRLSPR